MRPISHKDKILALLADGRERTAEDIANGTALPLDTVNPILGDLTRGIVRDKLHNLTTYRLYKK